MLDGTGSRYPAHLVDHIENIYWLRKGGVKDELLQDVTRRLVGGDAPEVLPECRHEPPEN